MKNSMKIIFSTTALCLLLAVPSNAASVTYVYEDTDGDETFNVTAQVSVGDGSTGLATYVVGLRGLDAYPSLDPTAFTWVENVLSNLNTSFVPTGFQAGLLSGPVGTNEYSATNSQFNIGGAMYGVGQVDIFVEPAAGPPNNEIIDLDAIALLGQLTIPGANELTHEELNGLLNPDAALFASENPLDVVAPTNIFTCLGYTCIPEPNTLVLVGLALVCVASHSRRKQA
jgi:hypothetical protein